MFRTRLLLLIPLTVLAGLIGTLFFFPSAYEVSSLSVCIFLDESLRSRGREDGSTNPSAGSLTQVREVGELVIPAGLAYPQSRAMHGRPDVNSVTNWNVPLVWEGTFDPVVIDAIYKKLGFRIGLAVFAVEKNTRFLKRFLETAERNFFMDFRVIYYVFTDHEEEVPEVALAEGRTVTTIKIPSVSRWQDVVLAKMKWTMIYIENQIRWEVDYLYMMSPDLLFHNRFGAETLSRLSATLHHRHYKNTDRQLFPYERLNRSQASIPAGEGDYYYTSAVWGGHIKDMSKLVRHCYIQTKIDVSRNVNAYLQEESYLNKYFLYNKPSKVLSPEYLWADDEHTAPEIKIIRLSQLVKSNA